jgi:hypothetical protein
MKEIVTNNVSLSQPTEDSILVSVAGHGEVQVTKHMFRFAETCLDLQSAGLSLRETCDRSGITLEEFRGWRNKFAWFDPWLKEQFRHYFSPAVYTQIARAAADPEYPINLAAAKLFLSLFANWSPSVRVEGQVGVSLSIEPGDDSYSARLALARQLREQQAIEVSHVVVPPA